MVDTERWRPIMTCDNKIPEGWGQGGTNPMSQPNYFANPASQCPNPISTSRIQKKKTKTILVLNIPTLFSTHQHYYFIEASYDSWKLANLKTREDYRRCSEEDQDLFHCTKAVQITTLIASRKSFIRLASVLILHEDSVPTLQICKLKVLVLIAPLYANIVDHKGRKK